MPLEDGIGGYTQLISKFWRLLFSEIRGSDRGWTQASNVLNIVVVKIQSQFRRIETVSVAMVRFREPKSHNSWHGAQNVERKHLEHFGLLERSIKYNLVDAHFGA